MCCACACVRTWGLHGKFELPAGLSKFQFNMGWGRCFISMCNSRRSARRPPARLNHKRRRASTNVGKYKDHIAPMVASGSLRPVRSVRPCSPPLRSRKSTPVFDHAYDAPGLFVIAFLGFSCNSRVHLGVFLLDLEDHPAPSFFVFGCRQGGGCACVRVGACNDA